MPIEERKTLISQLEAKINAKVLTLITGDRNGLETRIAPDIIPLIMEHLSSIGQIEHLALFLYTPGGDTIAGWGLVNLFRQHCKNFSVLVPFRALSCGTLIGLGADNLVMGTHGLLSPVDPSVSSPFNPPAPGIQAPGSINLLPVSVEDMIGFLELAKNEIGLKSEEAMISVLNILSNKVHPLALGAVFRAREQISSLAERLLKTHLSDADRINFIVKRLTKELPTHNYLIGRKEAEESIKLEIKKPSDEVDLIMWRLYKDYEGWLKLTSPYSPERDLGNDVQKIIKYPRAAVESLLDRDLFQHIFISENELVKVKTQESEKQGFSGRVNPRTIFMGWTASKNGEAV